MILYQQLVVVSDGWSGAVSRRPRRRKKKFFVGHDIDSLGHGRGSCLLLLCQIGGGSTRLHLRDTLLEKMENCVVAYNMLVAYMVFFRNGLSSLV